MEVLIICDKGATPACVTETKRYLKVSSQGENWLRAQGEQQAVANAVWYGQTMLEALQIIQEGEELQTKGWPEIKGTFAVRSSTEENEDWGARIKEATGLKVDLDNPDNIFVPFKADKLVLGLALTHKEMRKREYRVFTSNTSLRPTIAASVLRLAGYTGKEKLLLPYENDGTLAIEAALMATNKSPFAYEGVGEVLKAEPEPEQEATIDVAVPTVPYLKAIQKNAKIAGVHKSINVTKAELDWLDTKYEEHSKEIVVANLPASSKRRKEEDTKKIAQELAYQARYVLKGTLAILTLKPEEHEGIFSFEEKARHTLQMGGQEFTLLIYEVK